MTTMTLETFTAIAQGAGIDVNAHGGRSAYADALGCLPGQVSSAFRKGRVAPHLVAKATDLVSSLKSGAYVPPATTVASVDLDALPVNPEDEMSDDDLLASINKRFACMRRFVQFGIEGKFPSVLITGPGGIGKTYPVENMLRDADDGHRSIRMVSGAISAVKLYEMLWETRMKGDVLLIDDADGGLANVDFLNVLKAATDSKGRRVVSWMKQNKSLAEAGVEPQFEYHGSVIIISNANMKAKAEKGNGHVDALLSRAQHIDLGINSPRALALRVTHMIQVEEMFAQDFALAGLSHLHEKAKDEIGEFIKDNCESFRKLTLREAAKIAKMYIACEGEADWADMALLSLGQL